MNSVLLFKKTKAASELPKQNQWLSVFFVVTLFLGGCTTTQHRPEVEGGDLANYETDLAECQALASKHKDSKDKTKRNAGIGAAAGALIGLGEGGEEAVAGAVIGAIVAGGATALNTRKELKNVVIKCMQGKGYNVVDANE
ncbi:glycine zipper family protein [Alteromonadaceae bacterium M269]|nr:glycine zipper family protein [Alteromonadaceae bacterium M269]